jgi:hypothetical protein
VHPGFMVIATGNTDGRGATAEYNARIALDGSFLSRFTFMKWEADEGLESALYPESASVVQDMRARLEARGIKVKGGINLRHSSSMRALILGGYSSDEAREMIFRPLVTSDQWKAIAFG